MPVESYDNLWMSEETISESIKEDMKMEQKYITLNNGAVIPQFGLGVYMVPGDQATHDACLAALKMGYRHIDTAHAYQNERGVGSAVKESGIPREEIWITTKLWPSEYGEGKTMAGIPDC